MAFSSTPFTHLTRSTFRGAALSRRARVTPTGVPRHARSRLVAAPVTSPHMSLALGDSLPADAEFMTIDADGRKEVTVADVFSGKTVALFAVPGPFTPVCDTSHFPSYVENEAVLKEKGVDMIACTAVSDPYVMKAWAEAFSAQDKILMLSDGDAGFASAIGLTFDTGKIGGIRSARYSLLAKDGVVVKLNIDGSEYEKSTAEVMLAQLSESVDPLEAFCAQNPEAAECRTYED